ncbi:lecithin:cholesterol/ phospholipid:diacylglycerol acyltransferase, partial [Kipferlia bialata]|eukprot:g11733.t1
MYGSNIILCHLVFGTSDDHGDFHSYCEAHGIDIVPNTGNHGLEGITDLVPQLKTMSITSFKLVFGPLKDRLEADGYVAGETLFGYPYDWRNLFFGPAIQGGLSDLVDRVHRQTGLPVVLIGHSMGGQVIRAFMQKPDQCAK